MELIKINTKIGNENTKYLILNKHKFEFNNFQRSINSKTKKAMELCGFVIPVLT